MGYFKNINFSNYRNFTRYSLSFDKSLNIILGKNGSGKTNILEGISLFEKGRGFRKEKIVNLINFNNFDKRFNIDSKFQDDKLEFIVNVFNSEKNLKKISINESLEKETIKHFESLFSIISFLPEMERLFVSSPLSRRNFLDRLIFNFDKNYNFVINSYKKNINERQLLLKKQNYDLDWIQKLENDIAKYGLIIYQYRQRHVEIINSILAELKILKEFSNNIFLTLDDKLLKKNPKILEDQEIYLLELKNNRQTDFFSGSCNIGPHKSHLTGYSKLNNFNINQFSTGQQKTVVLLIIIAQCQYLINEKKFNPIILLDEICSHLDVSNRELLLYLIEQLKVQVFMTGAEKSFFSFLSTKANYCNIT